MPSLPASRAARAAPRTSGATTALATAAAEAAASKVVEAAAAAARAAPANVAAKPPKKAGSPRTPLPRLPGGLLYVNAAMPGFTRERSGAAFRFLNTEGRPVDDPDEIARINRLAIPPAYTDVWICPLVNGHLQATGIDARGRKQYRYHADWRVLRDGDKFQRLAAFGRALPRIRTRVDRDLATSRRKPLARNTVLATIVRLLDTTCVRVGNDEYARDNKSYGLTTLRNPHAGLSGSVLKLRFRGKGGIAHAVELDDPKVAAVVRRCQQLRGQELFHYEDDDGTVRSVGSGDVNDYLREIAGDDFTAKDFRTWHGTARALELTRRACSGEPGTSYRVSEVLGEVARHLRNTPAVCRKAYVHPAVLALGPSLSGDTEAALEYWGALAAACRSKNRLAAVEARLLAFLELHQKNVKKKRL